MFKDFSSIFVKVSCVVAVCIWCSGCGRNGPAEVDMRVDDADSAAAEGTHVVHNNETLYDIAYQYSVDPQNLAKINGLKPPYKLWNGQVLQLPVEGGGVSDVDDDGAKNPKAAELEKRYESKGYGEYSGVAAGAAGAAAGSNTAESGSEPVHKSEPTSSYTAPSIPSWDDDMDGVKSTPKNSKEAEKSKDSAKELATPKIVPTSTSSNSKTPEPKEKGKSAKNSRMVMPVKGRIISRFGDVNDGISNDGMNIKAAKGTSVVAAADGIVIYVGNKLDEEYGNVVILQHDGGLITSYAHLDKANVKKDARVNAGDIIGTVGSTGDVTEPQLYFEVMKDKKPVNPSKYLQ